MGCGKKTISVLLFVFNISLFLVGLALAAVGIWSVVDKIYVADVIGDDLFTAASIMVIIGGTIIMGISIFGICAVRSRRKVLVIVYFVLLLVVFIIILLAAILAVAFKSELEEKMVDTMRESLVRKYGSDFSVTKAWDKLQADLDCCSVRANYGNAPLPNENIEISRQDSWLLYSRTPWYQTEMQNLINTGGPQQEIKYVPKSCCVYDENIRGYRDLKKCQSWNLGPPGNLKNNLKNDALYYEGCYVKAKDLLAEHSDILVGCSFAFAFAMIAGLVLTIMLYRLLSQPVQVIRDPRSK